MEKLERQQRGLRDQYNTDQLNQNLHEYLNIANSDKHLIYAIQGDETLKEYLTKLDIHVDLAKTKNWRIHVLIGVRGKPWYTHSSPDRCFMCQDNEMIAYLTNLLHLIASKYPDIKP